VDCPPLPYSASTLLATPRFKFQVPFLWKNASFIEKNSLLYGSIAVRHEKKCSSTVKSALLLGKNALLLEKSAPLLGKSALLKENALFWLVHRCPNFLFLPLGKTRGIVIYLFYISTTPLPRGCAVPTTALVTPVYVSTGPWRNQNCQNELFSNYYTFYLLNVLHEIIFYTSIKYTYSLVSFYRYLWISSNKLFD